MLVFGLYPSDVTAGSRKEKTAILEELVASYLLKDILELERVKGAKALLDLLRLIAFQVGSLVSHHELGTQLGLDTKTVARYLDLLEKGFVLYNLRGYTRNLRKEIVKKGKYYFYDVGIRNAVIRNFNELELRGDLGGLWENFLVMERLKAQAYRDIPSNNYFWRTWDGHEVDWVEEREGQLFGYEFTFGSSRKRPPKSFLDTYTEARIDVVTKDNYLDFVGVE